MGLRSRGQVLDALLGWMTADPLDDG